MFQPYVVNGTSIKALSREIVTATRSNGKENMNSVSAWNSAKKTPIKNSANKLDGPNLLKNNISKTSGFKWQKEMKILKI